MDRLLELDLGDQTLRQLKRVRLTQLAVAARLVHLLDREVLALESSDRDGHPASLLAVVMYSRDMPRLPADRHHLEAIILVDQIPSVEVRAPEEESLDR